ncbi:MAG: M36 family metallopeptidase [Bacteroidota bacterium]
MKLKSTLLPFLLMMLFAGSTLLAQVAPPLDIANSHIRSNFDQWGLTMDDVQDVAVSSVTYDESTGISRVYLIQQHNGVPVYNAIINVNITKEGKVFHVGNRFEARLAENVNTTIPIISASQAVKNLATHLGLTADQVQLIEQTGQNEFLFAKGNLATDDIKVSLSYQPTDENVRLAWDVTFFPVKSSDMWNTRVDATTGKILNETNWTVYCNVDGRSFARTGHHNCSNHEHSFGTASTSSAALTGASYNVWPIPVESPIHGARELVKDPHDLDASPFGWHDVNGVDGPEYTITRGNNVHAYQDSLGQNASVGDEPDGGMDLLFDFPYDELDEPFKYVDAAVVNLFYFNNIMHDFAWHYGFDEAAGNFQFSNYTGQGLGGDFVNAEAQDGSGTNNANFATPPDGNNPRMQMFRWNIAGSAFRVDEPASVAGDYTFSTPTAGDWGDGAYITDMTSVVEAEVAIADDGVSEPLPTDACEPIQNGSELLGKVALIDRGGCEFGFKAARAEEQGAVAVIICNFEDGLIGMGAGAEGANVNIPAIFMGNSDCQTIRQFAGNGLLVSFELPMITGPAQFDSDLDNGVIAHEYGHGISNRLTGGPDQAGCLFGSEQMGEGWSDFMSLTTTARPGDVGQTPRGIGNYVDGLPTTGGGIRRFPYSTDMSINPLTYSWAPGESVPHGVGAVWCTILWDMYWALVDKYGFDEDLIKGTGGNNLATRYVFEGMKNQPCGPGFVTGRDAILKADSVLNDAENSCLIWGVFARRGVGFSADQGGTDIGDETEAFDVPCPCRDRITVTKSVTDFIEAGEEIDVTVFVSNCKVDPITNVEVSDIMPDGTNLVAGSANLPVDVQGNTLVFNLGDMPFGAEQTITFKLSTDPDQWSERLWIDEVVDFSAEDNMEIGFIGPVPDNAWQVTTQFGGYTGDYSWYMEAIPTESRVYIQQIEDQAFTVTGDRPVLRFWHIYNTEAGVDGGVLDIKNVNDDTWQQVPDQIIRNGYPGLIQYGTFVVPNLQAFSGNSGDEFIPVYVDLSDWAGQAIHLRYRYGSDAANGTNNGGWIVDDIEYQDLLAYNGEVCVTTDEGDNVCTIAPEEGTIVDSREVNNTFEELKDLSISTYPNPVNDLLNIAVESDRQQDIEFSLMTIDGKIVSRQMMQAYGKQFIQLNVSSYPAGFYFLKVATDEGTAVQKVVID